MVLFARWGSASVALALFVAIAGCSSIPTYPGLPHDAGTQCSDAEPCPSGQVCLQGLCFAACDATHGCAAGEMCSLGVCVGRTTDAGTHDAGSDGGPCAMLTCTTPTPVCRGDVASCVQCGADNDDECGLAAGPTCDVGRAHCTTPTPGICSPCTRTGDCPAGLTCVHRTAPDPEERVCLPACAGGACADQGLSCNAASQCVPFTGSCTVYYASVTNRSCASDADCPQLGATIDDGLVTGMCFDDGAHGGPTCHSACGLSTDCPAGLSCGPTHFCM
jgi:hypothetical protein